MKARSVNAQRRFFKFAYFFAVGLSLIGSSAAAGLKSYPMQITRGTGPVLDGSHIYAIKISCQPVGTLPQQKVSTGLFGGNEDTIAHYVVISSSPPTTTDTTTALSKALAFAYPYSVDQVNGTAFDNRSACNQEQLILDSNTVTLTAGFSDSTTFKQGDIQKFLTDLGGLANVLATVFTGTALSPNVDKTLANIASASGSLTSLAADLPPPNAQPTLDSSALTEGRTTVATSFSIVTIDVARINSVVEYSTTDSVFRDALKARAPAVSGDLASSCQLVASNVSLVGFTSDEDQAYAMVSSALKTAISTKQDLVTCLGAHYTPLSVSYGSAFWAGVPSDLVLGPADVLLLPQPPAQPLLTPTLSAFMENLTATLGSYAKTSPPTQAQINRLQQFLDPNFSMTDPNSEMPSPVPPPGLSAALNYLVQTLNYQRFGFYAQITDPTMLANYGSNVGFLAIAAKPGDTSGSVNQAIGLIPTFNGKLITSLRVTNDYSDVLNILGTRKSTTNFTFTDAPGASPPANNQSPAPGTSPTAGTDPKKQAATTTAH